MNSTEQRYHGEAGRVYHQGKRAVPSAAVPWVARLRAAKLQPHVSPADTVLEIGAGFGWNLAGLRCARRVASDLDDLLSAEIKAAGVEFVPNTQGLADAAFDCVICHHVLEHVLEPARMLGEAQRLLKPGGRLLLFVPYEKERRYLRYDPGEPNHHLYSWNAQTLANLATDCGFRVGEAGVGEFGYDRFAAARAVRWNLGERGFRWLRRVAHIIRPGLEVRLIGVKNPGGGMH